MKKKSAGILEPEDVFLKYYNKVPKNSKMAFIWSFILALCTHMYIMANNYPNHDGIRLIQGATDGLSLGRWFLRYACGWNGRIAFLNSSTLFVAIIALSLATAVIVDLFHIKNRISIFLISGIIVAFPAVTSIFSYTFAADGHMIAFFLAIAAVKVCDSPKRYSVIKGGVLLCLAMGIYQAYIAVSATLIVILFIYKIISGAYKTLQQVFKDTGKFVIMGILGSVLYFIMLNICLEIYGVQLAEYQGIGNLGAMSISYYFNNIISTYKHFIEFFQIPVISRNVFVLAITIIGLISVIGLLLMFVADKNIEMWQKIAAIIFVLLLPVAVNLVTITSNEIFYHMVMKQGYCLIYILPIILMSGLSVKYNENAERYFGLNQYLIKIKYVITAVTAVMVIDFIVIANIGYWSLEVKNQRVYGLMNRIVYSIENFEGFSYDMPVYFTGSEENKFYLNTKMSDDEIEGLTGIEKSTLVYGDGKFHDYVQNYLGVYFKSTSTKQREAIDASEEFKEMNNYPEKDSITIIDGVLVVKM